MDIKLYEDEYAIILNKKIHIIRDECETRYILSSDISTFHNESLKKINQAIKRFIDRGLFNDTECIDVMNDMEFKKYVASNGQKKLFVLNKDGYLKLKLYKKDKLDKNSNLILSEYFLCKDKVMYISKREEKYFFDSLTLALKPFGLKIINQYRVLNYRIDGFIPELNMAIEYDENDHRCYTYAEHKGRQKKIEDELNCVFVRLSDSNDSYYNIGIVLKEIFKKDNETRRIKAC